MELAKAYVQIIPTTKDMKSNITKELGGDLDDAGKTGGQIWANAISGFVTNALGTVTSMVTTAVTSTSEMVFDLTKQAVASYADYEQLVGGVETLFGESADAVVANAKEAFKTAGLSANDYMETVTGFSASLLQSLGGDTQEAVRIADMAIVDMADNANKMGTSMESIQNAYQGFAKQNYTMLDNLKLGYGGTKSEMERLLADATAISGVEYDLEKFSDIAEAIHVIQTELGITGTTAEEASTTIQGSIASMESAWQNVLVAMADDNADFGKAVDDLVNTIVGENGQGGVINNLVPRIEKTLMGIGDLVSKLAPVIMAKVPELITTILPTLLDAVKSMVTAVADNLPSIVTAITDVLPEVMDVIVGAMIDLLPVIVDCAFEIVYALADGLIEALPEITPQVVELVLKIADTIVNNLAPILESAIQIVIAMQEGLIRATPQLLEYGGQLMLDLVASMNDQILTFVESGFSAIEHFKQGAKDAVPSVLETAGRIIPDFIAQMAEHYDETARAGVDIALNIVQGIKDEWERWLGSNAITEMVQKLIDKIRSLFGNSVRNIDFTADINVDPFGSARSSLTGNSTQSKISSYNSATPSYSSSVYIPKASTPTVNVNLTSNTSKMFDAVVTANNTVQKISGINRLR